MTVSHLSDEAVAAFADGVLRGHARERAARHVDACAECRHAVQVQREAALALRAAGTPQLPSALVERLRSVPMTTPLTTLPTAIAPDGSTMLSTVGQLSTVGPLAAFVPAGAATESRTHRARPYVTTAAVVALAGALTAGSVARQQATPAPGSGHFVRNTTAPAFHGNGHGAPAGQNPADRNQVIDPVTFFRVAAP